MKITNKTHWETKHIRSLVSEVIRRSPAYLKDQYRLKKYRKNLHVTVGYSRNGNISGFGWYNSWSIKLGVPANTIDKAVLARVIAHELAHTLNYHHKDMKGNALFYGVGNSHEIYAWAEHWPFGKTAPKARSQGAELKLARLGRVLKRESQWETKLKRAQNALKKIKVQRRYYERSLAALGVATLEKTK